MNPQLKQRNFRSQKLRDLAAQCPKCMHCGHPQDGTIVACHSNSQKHGKGIGLKAHDAPAYLCGTCHSLVDGRTGTLTQHEREDMFLGAAYETWVWLMQSGYLQVA